MKRTYTIELENRTGELARIVGLFSARGLNIESLSVRETSDRERAHVCVTTDADERSLELLAKAFARQVGVIAVTEHESSRGAAAVEVKERTRMNALYDTDIDCNVLAGKKVAIIGYGSQGHAHADSLKESGCDVVVGLREGSPSRAKAERQGHEVRSAAAAARVADVVMMLVPDELAPRVYREELAPNLRLGSYLGFAHGFSIHFRKIVPREDLNVFMVAPKGPGHLVRHEYSKKRGVPCLVAVDQSPATDTRKVALAYASSIGGGRAGILETTFKEETETDLFGEQAVLCGGLTSLIQAGFETLVEAGYAPEMAYFECLHEMKLIVDLVYEGGLSKMRDSISNTAEYGDLTRGQRVITQATRSEMRRILDEITSGRFADEWMAECEAGKPRFSRLEAAAAQHPIEEVGKRLRAMMPWLDQR